MKINLYTVCTGDYPTYYAEKAITRFKELSSFDVTAYCITDRPEEIKNFANVITPKYEVEGWWNKMFCYDPDNAPGWNVYLDLDMVLVDSFDKEIKYAIKQNKKIACFKDCIKWHKNDFNSSFMVWKTGSMTDIWDVWLKIKNKLNNYKGGDQVWVGKLMLKNRSPVLYLDKKFPYSKLSLKYQVGQFKEGQLMLPKSIDSVPVKIIDCSGKPKPCVLVKQVPWIDKHWGSVKCIHTKSRVG